MLAKILETKKIENLQLNSKKINEIHEHREGKSLIHALKHPKRDIALIAEIKKASPSKGVIRADFNPVEIAKQFIEAKVDAISVLTDETYFQGSIDYIKLVKEVVDVPVLRKDFIISEAQVIQSVEYGADALLLIAEALEVQKLKKLYELATSLGVEVLLEVHSSRKLLEVLDTFNPKIIGINNRDLTTFETSIETTKSVMSLVPASSILVSESGIFTRADLDYVKKYGANAVLVGEAIMKSNDIQEGIEKMFSREVGK
ncbi:MULTISPECIES: indole-3-glycerol phosphate synthase TrpC [Bacillus]|uniref:indole-3-glycerol phosphate synthase TrpC n=1 Tax=Bacillus TaxID=1386 RepID=UPI000BB8538D|nr:MULTISPECIES: indole-3-glycerol phosphate synthase TrpC [Bacillus]